MNSRVRKTDIENIQSIHMIGIGGIGMSGLARFFLHEKKGVSGSDQNMTAITQTLEKEGVDFFADQGAHNIVDDIDLVVYTEAMSNDHPEIAAAKAKGIPTLSYFETLGMVANEYYLIAVAGTHGKTTTTAMAIDVLEEAGLDPTAIVGSLRSRTGSNFRAGQSKYCIVEACEYRRHFLSLTPDVLIITNIEAEHLDYYRDLTDVQDAFKELVGQVREEGVVICNPNDKNVAPVVLDTGRDVIDYTKFVDPLLQLKVPGVHNLMNAGGVLALAERLHIKEEEAKSTLEEFAGTWRRFEYKGVIPQSDVPVYDDYGHHPTEITATLDTARSMYPQKNITIVFQPHQLVRLEELLDDFVGALTAFDRVIITKAYAVRETHETNTDSKTLTDAITKTGADALYIENFADIVSFLKENTKEHDVVLVVGAGDITQVAHDLVQ